MKSFLLACLFVVAIGFAHADEPEKIVGGNVAAPGEFPYIVSIRFGSYHTCGGAIIGPKHILTAAHCVYGLKGLAGVVVATGSNSVTGGEIHRVANMYANPAYSKKVQWHNDIGIIKLAAPITFSDVQKPIDLPTAPLPEHSDVVISGWGRAGVGPKRHAPNLLQKITLRSITKDECQRYYPARQMVDTQICTFKDVNFGTCNGDSGGPLAFNNQIHGVVSGGIPCARGMPDVFTSVYHHLDFIKQAMTY